MTKQIQAYFKTEDDAESAKTKLLGFETEHLEVSRLGEHLGRNNQILLPIAPVNMAGNMNAGGATGSMGAPSAYPASGIPIVDDRDPSEESAEDRLDRTKDDNTLLGTADISPDEDYHNLEYVLAAKVQDNEYDEIVNKLRANGAHVEIFD